MTMERPRENTPIRTKIVCTLGPASSSPGVLDAMIRAGADVFRLNFSHGTHDSHRRSISMVRALEKEHGRPFTILGDLSGPKLRIGTIPGGGVELESGKMVVLTPGDSDGSGGRIPVQVEAFHSFVRKGEKVLLDDGRILLVVEEIRGREVSCRIVDGGVLTSNKGLNLPDTDLPIPALTDKDRADLRFAAEVGVDVLALSFVRRPGDMEHARRAIEETGHDIPLYAKIEKGEAVHNLREILLLSDGAMVARGDLGIEIPMEDVPNAQKQIIRLCNQLARPVITATQMLESMIVNPRPTRAEVTDIYNAILDGTDAVMLSAETAVGKHPVEAVKVMNAVAAEAEKVLAADRGLTWLTTESGQSFYDSLAICQSAVLVAAQLGLDLIIVPTDSGYSAIQVSRFKPKVPVFACSWNPGTVRKLGLAWGIEAREMTAPDKEELARSQTDALIDSAVLAAKKLGFARAGTRAVIIGGLPFGERHQTNFMQTLTIE